jgi:hypothetical protein
MPEALPERLRTAAELIKNSQIKEARSIIASYIRQYPSSDEAWFLLSYVAPQKGLQVDCLMRVLSLNPNHTEAKNRLARLNPPSQAATLSAYSQFTESQKTEDSISPALQTLPEENPTPSQSPAMPGKKTMQDGLIVLQSPAHFAEPYPERPVLLPDPQTSSTTEKGRETTVPTL